MAIAALAGVANTASAGGKLPPAAPHDVQAVQACLGSRWQFDAASCIGAVANACLKTADSQQRMTQCMVRERAVWDLFLNNDYPEVMKSLAPAAQRELREVERQFVTNTERRCTFIRTAMGFSSYVQVVEIEACMMHATAVQWLWLRDFLPVKEKGPKPYKY
jgi:uncharacterized protein YecT (DUF1311 family)